MFNFKFDRERSEVYKHIPIVSKSATLVLRPDSLATLSPFNLPPSVPGTGPRVFFPTLLFNWATENRVSLVNAGIACDVLALAIDLLPGDCSQSPQPCWTLWAGRSEPQLEFAYNLAIETGVPVRLVPVDQVPVGIPSLMLLKGNPEPFSDLSNIPTPTASASGSKPGPTSHVAGGGNIGNGSGGLPARGDSHNSAGKEADETSNQGGAEDNGKKEGGGKKEGNEDDDEDDDEQKDLADVVDHVAAKPDTISTRKNTVLFQELPDSQSGFGAVSTLLHSVAVVQPEDSTVRQAQSRVKLQHVSSIGHQLQRAFICVRGPPGLATIETTCENPVPLGTDKYGSKSTTTKTLGLNEALSSAAAPIINATLTFARGEENSYERQFSLGTSFISEVFNTTTRSVTFRITPRLMSELPGALDVTLTTFMCTLDPPPVPLKSLDITVTAQWHLLDTCRKERLPVFFVLLHEATEDVLKPWVRSEGLNSFSSAHWQAGAKDGVSALDMLTLIHAAEQSKNLQTKAAGVRLDLEERLKPNKSRSHLYRFLQTIIHPFRSFKVRRLQLDSFEINGKAGWMLMTAERADPFHLLQADLEAGEKHRFKLSL
ncbi:hypothetical protein C8J56DRAFT_949301 [Mycena floridula]|nr:hypothetical protein C8J56DRAFT_949301 [Mycena floridula]